MENLFLRPMANDPHAIEAGITRRLLETLTDEDRTALHAVPVIRKSDAPAEEIVKYAQAEQIDLIVMGTHGRPGLAHLLMGSVAEKVVRTAPCPVLTLRHRNASSSSPTRRRPQRPEDLRTENVTAQTSSGISDTRQSESERFAMIALKNILVATDFGEASDAALAYGRELARTFGATLHVLNVADDVVCEARRRRVRRGAPGTAEGCRRDGAQAARHAADRQRPAADPGQEGRRDVERDGGGHRPVRARLRTST